jgi:hypothetical protein
VLISGLTSWCCCAGGKAAVARLWDHKNFRYFLEVPPAPCTTAMLLAHAACFLRSSPAACLA